MSMVDLSCTLRGLGFFIITPHPPPSLLPPVRDKSCSHWPEAWQAEARAVEQQQGLSRVPDRGEAACRSGPCRQACSHRPCSSCTTFIGLEQHRRASVHQPPRGVVVGAAYQLRPSLNIPLLSVAKKDPDLVSMGEWVKDNC